MITAKRRNPCEGPVGVLGNRQVLAGEEVGIAGSVLEDGLIDDPLALRGVEDLVSLHMLDLLALILLRLRRVFGVAVIVLGRDR